MKKMCPATGKPERRFIEYLNNDYTNSESVPQAWYQWLNHLREHPPTITDLHTERANFARTQDRIREWEIQDQKKRLTHMKDLDLDVNAFVSQVTNQHATRAPDGTKYSAPQPTATATTQPPHRQSSGDGVAPKFHSTDSPSNAAPVSNTFTPAGTAPSRYNKTAEQLAAAQKADAINSGPDSDGLGQGEKFVAGSWKPKPRTPPTPPSQ